MLAHAAINHASLPKLSWHQNLTFPLQLNSNTIAFTNVPHMTQHVAIDYEISERQTERQGQNMAPQKKR